MTAPEMSKALSLESVHITAKIATSAERSNEQWLTLTSATEVFEVESSAMRSPPAFPSAFHDKSSFCSTAFRKIAAHPASRQ